MLWRWHRSTNKYCDVLFVEWLNQGPFTAAKLCSDCNLGVTKMQLDSPFGYNDEFAADFVSLTSSCSKTGYAFTKPPPYTVSTSPTSTTSAATATPTLDSSCVTLYTIQNGDTCNTI